MTEVRIPKKFFDDHVERELEAPPVIRETASHYWIDGGHEAVAELMSDAAYYASPDGPDQGPAGLRPSARALLAALEAAGVSPGASPGPR